MGSFNAVDAGKLAGHKLAIHEIFDFLKAKLTCKFEAPKHGRVLRNIIGSLTNGFVVLPEDFPFTVTDQNANGGGSRVTAGASV